MTGFRSLLLCLACVVSGGCIPSLHPLFKPDQVVFKAALEGTWQPADDNETWQFRPGTGKAYELTITGSDGRSGWFVAHLCCIDGKLFLDLQPDKEHLTGSKFYQAYLLPVHLFFYVEQLQPTLRMRFIQPKWLQRYLQEHPGAVEHTTVEGSLLLTAPTDKLQRFVVEHLETEGALSDPGELHRQ